MIHLLLLFLATLGFGLLCLSRDRHQRDLIGRKLSGRTANHIRRGGISSLISAFLLAGYSFGWAVGTLEWLGVSSAGAVVTMLLLARRTRRNGSPHKA